MYYIGIDIGSTCAKVAVFEENDKKQLADYVNVLIY